MERERNDGRELGANCDKCPFNCANPVLPRPSYPDRRARLVVIGENPSASDEDTGRPFSGAAQVNLRKFCSIPSGQLHLTHALLCKPPPHTPPKDIKLAMECCRPRLERELSWADRETVILAAGDRALQAIEGRGQVTLWRGYPLTAKDEYGGARTYPILPFYRLISNPALGPVFQTDIDRAVALSEGREEVWEWPPVEIEPSPKMQDLLVKIANSDYIAVDVETNSIVSVEARLTCIGLASKDAMVSVPWPCHDHAVKCLVLDILNSRIPKVFHNGVYDLMVFRKAGIAVSGEIHDTLLMHHTVAPLLPHDLGFVASCEFMAPRWKELAQADFKEHQIYNARDSYMTIAIFYRLAAKLKGTLQGPELYAEFQALQKIVLDMQEKGCLVDESAKAPHQEKVLADMERASKTYERMLKAVGLDPADYPLGKNGAHRSLKTLFYEKLGCEVTRRSKKTGKPQLDEEALQGIIAYSDSEFARELAKIIISYRKPFKLLSAYIDGLPVRQSGRIHPTWKVHGTITRRWSSAEPNFQNIPKPMRNMFIADPGNVIGASDYSALELRLIALLSGDEPLLDAFNSGADVHKMNAAMLFGGKPADIPDAQRQIAKTFVYLAIYGGSPDKLRESLIKQGYTFTIMETKELLKNFFKGHPAIKKFHKTLSQTAYEEWYVEEPISGWRQYFHDGRVDINKVLNFPCQASAGTLMNASVQKVAGMLSEGESIVAQVHDALYIQGPDPKRLQKILKKGMEQTLSVGDYSLDFPVDFGFGPNLRDLKPLP